MLTNLFYYNYYKPFLVHSSPSERAAVTGTRKKQAVKDTLAYNTEFYKNISLKNDVVSYAKGFSASVVGLKEAAHIIDRNADSIKMAAHTESMESAYKWLEEDVSDFVESYNNARSFAQSQSHSRSVVNLSDDVSNDVFDSERALKRIGIAVSEDGYLDFDIARIEGYSYSKLSTALDGVKDFAQTVYNKTTEFLQHPLSDHMKFRSLNYYYNYKLGTVTHNPFQLVESGMLVDRTV